MSETETSAAPKPRKKARKPVKRAHAPRARPDPAAPPPAAAYPGLSHKECGNTCGPNGCAITGTKFCGHPAKGGFSFIDKGDPAALRRYEDAQKQLAAAALDKP